jgi:uncharacterized protein (DUF433 family)
MIITYRVFREESGHFTIREVFYERDGQMIAYGATPVTPTGGSLNELTQELAWLVEALASPILTIAEADAEIAKHPPRPKQTGKNISHEELVAKLGLTASLGNGEEVSAAYNAQNGYIEMELEKQSGAPVFSGTRVPVQSLFDSLEAGESVEEFLNQHPTVAREQAMRVLEASKEKLIAGYKALV